MQDQPTTHVELAIAVNHVVTQLSEETPAAHLATLRRAADCLATGRFPPPETHAIEYRGPVLDVQSAFAPGQVLELEPDKRPPVAMPDISVGVDVSDEGVQVMVVGRNSGHDTVLYSKLHPVPRQRFTAADVEELRRALCEIGVIAQIDGHDVIRRSSMLDIIDRRISAALQKEPQS